MKLATLTGLAALSTTLIASHETNADYMGIGTRIHTHVNVDGAWRTVHRIYAVFSDPNDYLTAGAGSDQLGALSIQSRDALDTGPGSNFYNPGGSTIAGQVAPSSPSSPNYWGTYVTIGISDLTQAPTVNGSPVDSTSLSPGFPTFINGNQITNSNMAWFTPGPAEQGRAGTGLYDYFFNGVFGFTQGWGVQLMQLTVNLGDHVKGTLAVGVSLAEGPEGGQVIPNQTFGNWIPAPSAFGAFVLAGMFGPRRRRG